MDYGTKKRGRGASTGKSIEKTIADNVSVKFFAHKIIYLPLITLYIYVLLLGWKITGSHKQVISHHQNQNQTQNV